jgi:poly-beta-1,6-N-acetyl-D-glucosamine synthase
MLPAYVLITPARDEAQFMELTIRSMAAQTYRPLRWVIVSDGSTDGTDEIVSKHAAEHTWIELVRLPARPERNFAGKVHAFNAGKARVSDLEYEVIGNLDGDVSFEADHFQSLLSKFATDRRLGVAGAPFVEGAHRYDYRFSSIENVWGGCQMFRRQCFEEIGGYVPVKGGSVDHIAVVSARMKGWKTRTFTERVCVHHRLMGTAQSAGLTAKLKNGIKDYSVGNHPAWEVFRIAYQMTQRPLVLGAVALGVGYFWSMFRGLERPVSDELVSFIRREQMQRLKRLFRGSRGTLAAGATPR